MCVQFFFSCLQTKRIHIVCYHTWVQSIAQEEKKRDKIRAEDLQENYITLEFGWVVF